jgi:hypothetical protein
MGLKIASETPTCRGAIHRALAASRITSAAADSDNSN